MKKIVFPLLGLVIIVVASCQKGADEKTPKKKVKDQILGKWKLDYSTDDYYHPINTLFDHEQYDGRPGDSVVFRNDGFAYGYTDDHGGPEEIPYELINDSTISIDDEPYKIRKLTDTEMYLYQEEIYTGADQRYVIQTFLIR